tara:strand:+ start:134 stop:610 length:477 start_codon:yes stop_codon:yes gene_type:complete
MDPLTLLGLGSAALNYLRRPKFLRGPAGAGIAALETIGPAIPYAVNPVLGGINSLLNLADTVSQTYNPETNIFDFTGDVVSPTIERLNTLQFKKMIEGIRPPSELPTRGPMTSSGPPNRQTTNNNSGGNPYTMPSQPTPQRSFINAPAFKGMGYTRGR